MVDTEEYTRSSGVFPQRDQLKSQWKLEERNYFMYPPPLRVSHEEYSESIYTIVPLVVEVDLRSALSLLCSLFKWGSEKASSEDTAAMRVSLFQARISNWERVTIPSEQGVIHSNQWCLPHERHSGLSAMSGIYEDCPQCACSALTLSEEPS